MIQDWLRKIFWGAEVETLPPDANADIVKLLDEIAAEKKAGLVPVSCDKCKRLVYRRDSKNVEHFNRNHDSFFAQLYCPECAPPYDTVTKRSDGSLHYSRTVPAHVVFVDVDGKELPNGGTENPKWNTA